MAKHTACAVTVVWTSMYQAYTRSRQLIVKRQRWLCALNTLNTMEIKYLQDRIEIKRINK